MVKVKLVVTGDMEVESLVPSLSHQFPEICDGEEVQWAKPRKLQCTTSHRLRRDAEPSRPMLDLARAMLAEVLAGREGTPANLVVVVEDVELANLGQEDVVAHHFRRAVQIELEKKSSDMNTRERHRRVVRERCSFHVFRPMPEAYFFADSEALRGIGITQTARLRSTDLEQFEVVDPAWLSQCHDENGRRNSAWWKHELHPKHYLDHLLRRSGMSGYDEVQHGASVLGSLRWREVPDKDPASVMFARSLFEDLADWFGVSSPIHGHTSPHFYADKRIHRGDLTLRNL